MFSGQRLNLKIGWHKADQVIPVCKCSLRDCIVSGNFFTSGSYQIARKNVTANNTATRSIGFHAVRQRWVKIANQLRLIGFSRNEDGARVDGHQTVHKSEAVVVCSQAAGGCRDGLIANVAGGVGGCCQCWRSAEHRSTFAIHITRHGVSQCWIGITIDACFVVGRDHQAGFANADAAICVADVVVARQGARHRCGHQCVCISTCAVIGAGTVARDREVFTVLKSSDGRSAVGVRQSRVDDRSVDACHAQGSWRNRHVVTDIRDVVVTGLGARSGTRSQRNVVIANILTGTARERARDLSQSIRGACRCQRTAGDAH